MNHETYITLNVVENARYTTGASPGCVGYAGDYEVRKGTVLVVRWWAPQEPGRPDVDTDVEILQCCYEANEIGVEKMLARIGEFYGEEE